MKSKIHSTAIISKKAHLDRDVEIGPYCVIEGKVCIAKGTKIYNNVTIKGNTQIGKKNVLFSGAVIGSMPQDLKYKGEGSFLKIGDNNIFREYITVNSGTNSGATSVGNNSLFMAYSHIAHDCIVGDNCIFANSATLAGHVHVEDEVVLGGLTAVHQFVRIGRLAIIGGCSKVVQDIVPFSMSDGHPAKIFGINSVGLKRAKITTKNIMQLKSAFKIIFHSKLSLSNALTRIEKEFTKNSCELSCLLQFIKESKRGVSR